MTLETESLEVEEQAEDAGGLAGAADPAADAVETQADPEEITVEIAGVEPEPQDEARAPDWLRELRKSNREKDKRIRELESKQSAAQPAGPITPGPRPTLAECDYDEDKHAASLDAWLERRQAADAEARKVADAQAAAQREWQGRLDFYAKSRAALKVADFGDAEGAVMDTLNATQQGVILNGAENPALLVYAIGKNPKKARELAGITDPVKFAFAAAKLETALKVTPKKAPPPPERIVRGSAPSSGAVDQTYERLVNEAQKTGDMSKLRDYRRQQRAKAA